MTTELKLKTKFTLGERFRMFKATSYYQTLLSLGLINVWNKIIRFFKESRYERHIGRMTMLKYETPYDVEKDLVDRKWGYKPDPLGGRLDYIISPEIAALKMAYPGSFEESFDCDDQHFYVAYHLAQMKDVEDVLLLFTGWRESAHATVVYTYQGRKFQFNYGIQEIQNYLDAPHHVILRHAKDLEKQYIVYYVFQAVKAGETLPSKPFLVGSGPLHNVRHIENPVK